MLLFKTYKNNPSKGSKRNDDHLILCWSRFGYAIVQAHLRVVNLLKVGNEFMELDGFHGISSSTIGSSVGTCNFRSSEDELKYNEPIQIGTPAPLC
jgi:hypothetical protein